MPEWNGDERRENRAVCVLHGSFDRKLDQIIERQIQQVQNVEHLQNIVEDGLKSTVVSIAETLDAFVERMEAIEDFEWFRTWVTGLRDNLFKNTLKVAIIGGGIYAALHFGDKLFLKVFG